MKYEKPIIFSLKSPIETLCGAGSFAAGNYGDCGKGESHNDLCGSGAAPAPYNCIPGISFTSACTPGGEPGCIGGSSVAYISHCTPGGVANLCSTGTTG